MTIEQKYITVLVLFSSILSYRVSYIVLYQPTSFFLPDLPVVSSKNNKGVWIGLVNDAIWDHSGETVSYTKPWANVQPYLDSSLQDCTILGFDKKWYDEFCSDEFGFICEKENGK